MKSRTWLWIGLTIIILAAAGALWWFVYRPQAALTGCTGVEVYDLANYGDGANACLVVGEYTAADLVAAGIPSETITSIIIDPGFKATAYIGNDFRGDSLEFTADVKNLEDVYTGSGLTRRNWDNVISSIKVETAPTCAVAVYDLADYGGYGACLAVGDYTAAALLAKNVPDNTIASIKVTSGYLAMLFADDNFSRTGSQQSAVQDIPDLSALSSNWDNRISSIKVLKISDQTAIIFGLPNYSGWSTTLAAGDYNTTALLTATGLTESDLTGATNGISSVKVKSGYKATLYQGDLTGTSLELTADAPDLAATTPNFDNLTLSLKVVLATTTCTGATVYVDTTYGSGASACLAPGDYTTAALSAKSIADNSISSIKVTSGYLAMLFDADNYSRTQSQQSLVQDHDDLSTFPYSTSSWDNRISSIKVVKMSDHPAIVFGQPNYFGWSATLAAGDYNTAALLAATGLTASDLTGATNGISSVKVKSGYKATLYQDNLTGTSLELAVNTPDLAATTPNFDNKTLSLKVVLGETTTCPAPTSETRTQSCPTGQTGSITQTRTKGAAPTCAWGDWQTTSNTCVTTSTTPTTPTTTTTTPSTTTTTTTRPAGTGPETPLVAGGLLSLAVGVYYWIRRKI